MIFINAESIIMIIKFVSTNQVTPPILLKKGEADIYLSIYKHIFFNTSLHQFSFFHFNTQTQTQTKTHRLVHLFTHSVCRHLQIYPFLCLPIFRLSIFFFFTFWDGRGRSDTKIHHVNFVAIDF